MSQPDPSQNPGFLSNHASSAGSKVELKENNMDTPEHQTIYEKGLEIRKKVVGEEYVEKALEGGKSDFLRPLQQFATVFLALSFLFLLFLHLISIPYFPISCDGIIMSLSAGSDNNG
jgi:hypothetical protein